MSPSDSFLGQLIALDSQVAELSTQLETLRFQNKKLKEALYQEFDRQERDGFLKRLYLEYLDRKKHGK